MSKDILLDLPQGKFITRAVITASPDIYHPLIQRSVMIMLNRRDSGMLVNGNTVMELVGKANVSDASLLAQSLSGVADTILSLLNDEEKVANGVYFEVTVDNNCFTLNINIEPVEEDTVSAVIYTNG